MTRVSQFVSSAVEVNRNIDDSTYDNIKIIVENIDEINNLGEKLEPVDTIAKLRTMTSGISTIYVSGYWDKDDGAFGSHFFKWNPLSTESDNGGTIIKLDTIATGRYELQYTGFASPKWFGAKGDDSNDDTLYIQKALDSCIAVQITDGTYDLTDGLNMVVCKYLLLDSTAELKQTTINKPVITVDNRYGVFISANGATFRGEGSYDSSWTGNSGHYDQVIRFISSTNCGITNPVILNGANAGLYIDGCVGFRGLNLVIEGTNTYSTPINSLDNFQNGVYIKHNPTTRDCTDIQLTFDISGTAQGILVEASSTYSGIGNSIHLKGLIHNITGQHGCYLQSGNVTVDIITRGIELDGCKVQTNGEYQIHNIDLKVNAENCGSHAVELQNASTAGVAGLSNISLDIVCNNAQRVLGISNDIKDVRGTVIGSNLSSYGIMMQGTGLEDIDLDIQVKNVGIHGVYVDASDCKNINLKAKVREANTSAGAGNGCYIENAGDISLTELECTDKDTNQVYGLYVANGNVSVRGKTILTGAISHSARTNVELVEWTDNAILDDVTEQSLMGISGFSNSNKILTTSAYTVDTTDLLLFQKNLAEDSSFSATFDMLGKFNDSSERRNIKVSVLASRVGTNDVVIDGTTVLSDISSSGFTGVYSIVVSGSSLLLKVNSGGTTNVWWKSRNLINKE